jgi:predicted enzyme related to lactoylglutathione lyase
VFGWTTESFDLGDSQMTMFRVPGYVGGEPEQPVSREVVAAMAAGEAPARWSLDFWVDDVDAAVARTERSGGTTVVAPFDTSVGRTALLADPAGAAFSITRIAVAR